MLWATLLIIAYRGVTAIIFDQASAPRADGTEPAGAAAAQFPVTLAEAYATEFGQVYLNFSPAIQAQREQQLAAFVPASVAAANPDLGWNGAGQLSLQSEQVAGIAVADPQPCRGDPAGHRERPAHGARRARVASGGGVVIPGEPAWLPAPQRISPPTVASAGSDPVAQGQLMAELPAFFEAYATGDSAALSRFEAPRRVTDRAGRRAHVRLDREPAGAAGRRHQTDNRDRHMAGSRGRRRQASPNSRSHMPCRSRNFKAANGM